MRVRILASIVAVSSINACGGTGTDDPLQPTGTTPPTSPAVATAPPPTLPVDRWRSQRARLYRQILVERFGANVPIDAALELILEGEPDSRFEAVAYLVNKRERRGVCTGTLIGCRKVLTAAHCFKSGGIFNLSVADYVLYFQHAGPLDVSSIERFCDTAAAACDHRVHDLAVVTLAQLPGIEPYDLARHDDWQNGSAAHIVGFGVSGVDSDRGIKRSGRITAVDCPESTPCLDIAGRHANCTADSGGPMLITGPSPKLLGVAKRGGVCDEATGRYLSMTHEAYADWIADQLEIQGVCQLAAEFAPQEVPGGVEIATELVSVPLPPGLRNAQANLNFEMGRGNVFDLQAPADATCRRRGETVSCDLPGPYDGTESIAVMRLEPTPPDSFYQLTLVRR